jgi:hypothetical protein
VFLKFCHTGMARQTNKRQRRGNDPLPVSPIGNFYSGRSHRDVQSSNDANEESFFWQPGATLPISSSPLCSTPHRSTSINLQSTTLQSESESDEEVPLKATLQAILSSQTTLQKRMEEVLCRVNCLEESVKESCVSSSSSCDERKRKKRLSSELCGRVATVYQAMDSDDQFHLSERGDSVWNKRVKTKLRDEISLSDKENGYSLSEIDLAIKRYFESRKRNHRECKPEHKQRVSAQEKQRKTRSRRQRVSEIILLVGIFVNI